ncbi:hypothetical protein Gpo141_00013608 [Globisporangium polare]
MTIQETGTFAAYLNGEVEIDAPPTFLNATVPRAVSVKLLAFHENSIEGILIAKVPAGVGMSKRTSFKALVTKMDRSNRGLGGADPILNGFLDAVKRLDYDHETRLLTAVLASKNAAAAWDNCRFKMQYGVLVFVTDDVLNPTATTGANSSTTLTRLYDLRVRCSAAITALDIGQIFSVVFDAPTLTLTRGIHGNEDKCDGLNREITLQSDRCPAKLDGVSHVSTARGEIFIHHVDVHSRPPCYRCDGNSHSIANCKAADTDVAQALYHREAELSSTAA